MVTQCASESYVDLLLKSNEKSSAVVFYVICFACIVLVTALIMLRIIIKDICQSLVSTITILCNSIVKIVGIKYKYLVQGEIILERKRSLYNSPKKNIILQCIRIWFEK